MNYLEQRRKLILDAIEILEVDIFLDQHDNHKKKFDYFFYKFTTQSNKVTYLLDQIDFYHHFFNEIAEKTNLSLSYQINSLKEKIKIDSSGFEIFGFYLIFHQYAEQFVLFYNEPGIGIEYVDAFLNLFVNKKPNLIG